MPKCDIAETTNGSECNHCFREWLADDDLYAYALEPCKKCEIRHLRRNMIEKINGHYCESCAAEYEQELLAKMTA